MTHDNTLLLFFFLLIVFLAQSNAQTNPYKAPLYWSVYEHHYVKEQAGVSDNYIPESELLANINWIDTVLKPHGYTMVCMDGWGDNTQLTVNGYRKSHSKHWTHDFAWWAAYLQSRGMNLGMYGDPLWVHVSATDTTMKIIGTNINVSSLLNPSENAWCSWAQIDRPGAEQYVKGYIKFYADMGIKYYRCDFLSWYETGYDRNVGTVGPARSRATYETALKWIKEACDSNGVFLSLVMPNLTNEAEFEKKYGHMFRINSDCGIGTWYRFSDFSRGIRYPAWSQYDNAMDGYTYWSYLAGRNSIILDGDFIRINTFTTDSEKRSVISMHLLAGGPVTPTDQYTTIGSNAWVYQNDEMLALNRDGFVGKPLTNNPTVDSSQIWKGQMSNGDWIIGFFNRETQIMKRSIALSLLGVTGDYAVRDLWQHANIGVMDTLTANVPPHGCLVFRISKGAGTGTQQTITFDAISNKSYNAPDFSLNAAASSGLPVTYEVALGPASIVDNKVHLTGAGGLVAIIAKQSGNNAYNAAIPQVQSFTVLGGHQSKMYLAGTFTSWSPNISMTLTDDIWTAKSVLISAGNHELKFANTNNWSGDDWGNASGLSGFAKLATGGKPNITFTMAATGTYDIYFNDVTLAYSIGSKINGVEPSIAGNFAYDLHQNYPNPFNPSTVIRYSLKNSGITRLDIYNAMGEQVMNLINEYQASGEHEVKFVPGTLSSGVYFYTLSAGNYRATKKMILLK
jgi:hypothetical protein